MNAPSVAAAPLGAAVLIPLTGASGTPARAAAATAYP